MSVKFKSSMNRLNQNIAAVDSRIQNNETEVAVTVCNHDGAPPYCFYQTGRFSSLCFIMEQLFSSSLCHAWQRWKHSVLSCFLVQSVLRYSHSWLVSWKSQSDPLCLSTKFPPDLLAAFLASGLNKGFPALFYFKHSTFACSRWAKMRRHTTEMWPWTRSLKMVVTNLCE